MLLSATPICCIRENVFDFIDMFFSSLQKCVLICKAYKTGSCCRGCVNTDKKWNRNCCFWKVLTPIHGKMYILTRFWCSVLNNLDHNIRYNGWRNACFVWFGLHLCLQCVIAVKWLILTARSHGWSVAKVVFWHGM